MAPSAAFVTNAPPYVGRLAPSPTGRLHLGHARTFWVAQERALAANGRLLLRNDDLDAARCRPEFVAGFMEDLHWLGLYWELPIVTQSERLRHYQDAMIQLHAGGYIYPCHRSRKEVAAAASAPHESGLNDEPIYPIAWRPALDEIPENVAKHLDCNWRFRVPDGRTIAFEDRRMGDQCATAGRDFGDFLVWRKDGWPSYQLACAVDDGAMGITEVVRGADLVKSTFRQLLLLDALEMSRPNYFHCPLMRDENGERLAKRADALSLQTLREQGVTPSEIIAKFTL
ncbi:MAG: tRNA glutamyl-Q(34) synthetase GluQRS [Synoicihabitans sp.]